MEKLRVLSPIESTMTDVNPRKDTLASLMGIVQSLNSKLEDTTQQLQTLQTRVTEEQQQKHDLQQKLYRILEMSFCRSCQLYIKRVPNGKTITVCGTCQEKLNSIALLKTENEQLKRQIVRVKEEYDSLWDRFADLEEVIVK